MKRISISDQHRWARLTALESRGLFDRPAPGNFAFRTVDACGADDPYDWFLRVAARAGQRSTRREAFTVSNAILAETKEYCERRPESRRVAVGEAGSGVPWREPIWNASRLAVSKQAPTSQATTCLSAVARLAALRFRYVAAHTQDAKPLFADESGAPAQDSPTYPAWSEWRRLLLKRSSLEGQLARLARRTDKAWLRYADAELETCAPSEKATREAPRPKYAFGSMFVPELLDIYGDLFGRERLGETSLGAAFRFVAGFLEECEGIYEYYEARAFSVQGSMREHQLVFGSCNVGHRSMVESLGDEPLNRQVQDRLAIIKRRPREPAIGRELLIGRLPLVSGAFVNTRTKAQNLRILGVRSGMAPDR